MKNVVIFDLEATCEDKSIDNNYPSEIIEIGAVKLQDNKIVGEFSAFVKPTITNKLTSFCKELTTITDQNIRNAMTIEQVIPIFHEWIKDCKLISCGMYDKKQFKREIAMKNLEDVFLDFLSDLDVYHVNLKTIFKKKTGLKKKGMVGMANDLNIELSGTHHRGIDDAKNIAKIYLKLKNNY